MTKTERIQKERHEASIMAISTLYDIMIHELNVPAALITEYIKKDEYLRKHIFNDELSILVVMLHDDSIEDFAIKLKHDIMAEQSLTAQMK